MPCIVEAVRGEGLMGLVGLVSELKDRYVDRLSGVEVELALAAKEEPPGLWRRMLGICTTMLRYGCYLLAFVRVCGGSDFNRISLWGKKNH